MSLYNNDLGNPGIVRAIIVEIVNTKVRVYIPSINNSLTKETYMKIENRKSLPLASICISNPNANVMLHEGQFVWCLFEGGDHRYPVVIGLYGISTANSSDGDSSNTIGPLNVEGGEPTIISNSGGFILYNGLIRCMNGKDAGYEADEGLDIAAPIGTEIYSPCNGIIRYSEYGHTPWGISKFGADRKDTPYSIGINMSTSVNYAGKNISYIFLTHLSKLKYNVPDGSGGRTVKQGELIGWSGTANSSPHLHIGLSPSSWSPLRNNQVRSFFNSKYGQTWEVGK